MGLESILETAEAGIVYLAQHSSGTIRRKRTLATDLFS